MGGGAPEEPRWPGGAAPAAGEGIVDECAGGSSRPSEMKGSLRKASRSLAPFNNRAALGVCECAGRRPAEGSRAHRRGWAVSQAARPKRSFKRYGRSVTCGEDMELLGPPCASSSCG